MLTLKMVNNILNNIENSI